MRILTQSLTLEPAGGVEQSTIQTAAALARRGHGVTTLFGEGGALRARYDAAGIDLAGPLHFAFAPETALHDLVQFLPSVPRSRSLRPDVLWLQRFEHIVWAQVVSLSTRAPIVCHLHHLPNYRRVRELSTGVDQFIAVSHFMKDVWVRAGLPEDRVQVIHNAIPLEDYPTGDERDRAAARHALGIEDERPVVLFYGRPTRSKGILTLLEAFSLLLRRRPDALLVLVGDTGPPGEADVSAALGAVPAGAMRVFPATCHVLPYLHAADVVSFPSWVEEAFGRVPIEAMATGRPVVASRVGAVPEVLSGYMAPFLVEPGDARALEEKLAALLDWRRHSPRLGAACAAWVARRFAFDHHVASVEAVLAAGARTRRMPGWQFEPFATRSRRARAGAV
jgi:glycosyltransferase involved in cell wall biosynthesis